MYLQQPFPDRSKPKMKCEEIVLSIMLLVSASTFMMAQTPVDKSVGKGRQMTSAVFIPTELKVPRKIYL